MKTEMGAEPVLSNRCTWLSSIAQAKQLSTRLGNQNRHTVQKVFPDQNRSGIFSVARFP